MINDEQGDPLTESTAIAHRSQRYYSHLYAAATGTTYAEILDYLAHIKLPWLTNVHREYLLCPLEMEEITTALMG